MTAPIITIPLTDATFLRAASLDSRVGAGSSSHTSLAPEVYRRRRLTVVAVVVGLGLGLASFGRQADATPTPEAQAAAAVEIVVRPGDTLWGIAERLAPDADPRPLVAALGEAAGGSGLQPGQVLTVPGHLVD